MTVTANELPLDPQCMTMARGGERGEGRGVGGERGGGRGGRGERGRGRGVGGEG